MRTHTPYLRLLSLALPLSLLAATALAQPGATEPPPFVPYLAFETKRIEHTAQPGETSFKANFPFTNKTDKVVEVLHVQSTCGCTVATLEKMTYEPGEGGVIEAVFEYGDRAGPQEKTVSVMTLSAGGAGPQMEHLTIAVNLLDPLRVVPRLISWRSSEGGEERHLQVRLEPSLDPKPVRVETSDPAFEAHLEPTSDPYLMDLVVRLVGEATPRTANLLVYNEYLQTPYRVHLRVVQ